MTQTRESFSAGHVPKFLLLIDESIEGDRAVSFAARRAARLNARLFLLAVVEVEDFAGAHLFGAAEVMRAEAHEAAQNRLARAQAQLRLLGAASAEQAIFEGKAAEVIRATIAKERDIFALVLAASISNEGPGPLVSALSKNAGNFPVPIVIVPGHLSEEEMAALT